MSSYAFQQFVMRFKSRSIPGRHVYLWNGDLHSLYELIGKEKTVELDLSLLSPDSEDIPDSYIQEEMQKKLELHFSELYHIAKDRTGQQILIIKSSILIPRYSLGLSVLYNYYVGDHTMAILILPKPIERFRSRLPKYVICGGDKVLKYFSLMIPTENIIEGN